MLSDTVFVTESVSNFIWSSITPPVPFPDNTKSALVVIVLISLLSISISSTINLFVLKRWLVKSAVKAPAL